MKQGIIILVVLALLGLWMKNAYNGMVGSDEGVKNKWAQVQNQYQRRSDLIGNLVNTVKGAAKFETETLTKVIEARAKATAVTVDPTNITPEKLAEFQAAQGQLSQALGRLMVVSEQYPQLKANQNFLDLQTQLEGTENRCTVARTDYNDVVQGYNAQVRSFPNNILAGFFKFATRPTFEADPAAQKAPNVQF